MPLVSMIAELKRAQSGRYAVPCFDTFEMMGTQGIFAALEERRAPGIIGLYTGMFERPNPRALTDLVRAMAQEASVPVSICLDHGASFEHCMQALKVGFSDVMYDGSRLPLEENIATTQLVVRAAHAMGAGVEAELGHVGSGSNYGDFGAQRQGFTDPSDVERFVAETDVDCLAIAIGTAHGLYQSEPHLALDLLAEIRQRVEVPLVLHGGSGLSDEQFRSAVAGGICKINIFTNLAVEATSRMVANAATGQASFHSLTNQIHEGFQTVCAHCLDVFSTSGQADRA
jgi:fructose-bisphosphate aldolase class II